MEIVITIDDDIYDDYLKQGATLPKYGTAIDSLYEALWNGVPLPKRHGRLIDADKFHEVIENIPIKDTDKWFNWMQKTCNRLADAPTIIEGSDSV